jgi:hypothetical protein
MYPPNGQAIKTPVKPFAGPSGGFAGKTAQKTKSSYGRPPDWALSSLCMMILPLRKYFTYLTEVVNTPKEHKK